MKTEQFGVHYMLDGYGASSPLLKNVAGTNALLKDIVSSLSMHALHEPVVFEVGSQNRRDPGGISGFVVIAESHISFHTFPKRGFITVDVYTCQPDLDIDKLTKLFTEAFEIKQSDVFVQKRGLRYPSEDSYT